MLGDMNGHSWVFFHRLLGTFSFLIAQIDVNVYLSQQWFTEMGTTGEGDRTRAISVSLVVLY
jgi:hypothetical protein